MKNRTILWMIGFLVIVCVAAGALFRPLAAAFLANPVFNGMIVGVLLIGIGISFPTRKLCFEIENEQAIQIEFHPDIEDRKEHWQFQLLRPTADHVVAIALRSDHSSEKKIARVISS